MVRFFSIVTICFCSWAATAQINYTKQYFEAKQLFRERQYNLAMETFKPLIPYDQNNQFAEYASFYYSLSAYFQGYKAVAKDQLVQLKATYPKWDKMEEVNYWLGKIHLENGDYFQGLKVWNTIQDKRLQREIDAFKAKALTNVKDVETLKMMHEEYPKDEVIAKALAKQLTTNLADPANKSQLESLIQAFHWKRGEFIAEAPKTVRKDAYAVSVVMPFMISSLDATPTKKRNQIVLDLYEGMKLAVDSLAKMNISISLRAYDTERDAGRIKTLLETEELKNTDLIIGPYFPEENKVIQEFSLKNKVNVINPFFNNSEFVANNPFAYLFQPSVETLGRRSGEFLASYARKKSVMVFYGTGKRDSLLAASFSQAAREKGLRIVYSKMIPKDNVRSILNTLATPTEYDDFKYPKEFTLKKDSIGSIFVATDDPLLYAKVVSGVETRGDRIVVLGSEAWLDQSVVDFEKYQTLPILLAAPNFVSTADPQYVNFMKRYIKVHGRVPSNHAKMGFELMMFMGSMLKEHGVYFQEAFNKQGFMPGFLYEGFNYQNSRNNQYVPFIRYEDGNMRVINKP